MRPLILISLVFLCLLAPARAQMGMTNLPARPLSLEEAIRLALENNLDIARVRYEPQIAQFALSDVSAYYEPTLNFDARHSSESRAGTFDPTIGLIPGSSTETDAAALGVGGILPLTGLRYGLSGTYSHNFGTAAGAPIDIYRSTAGITLRQPLLRDLWIDANRLNVKLARKDIKISEYAVMAVIMDVVNKVQQTYYDLIAAQDDVRARELSLTLAQRLLDENRKKIKIGVMAPLDEKQAESEAALREAELIQATGTVNTTENILKNLISNNYQQWYAVRIEPTEKLVAVPQAFDLQESWINGLTLRPDYNQLKERLERQGIIVGYRFNQMFPILDLVGSYGRSGSDSLRFVRPDTNLPPVAVGPSYSRTLEQIKDESNPSYSYGVVLQVPLTFRQERSRHKEAKAFEEQAKLDVQIKHEQILVGIHDAIRSAHTAFERVRATRAGREFAQVALDAAQKRLDNGKATSFEVLRLQRDLTDARSQEIDAISDYNKSLAELWTREGLILKKNRVQVEITK
jgi:outer membrane protein